MIITILHVIIPIIMIFMVNANTNNNTNNQSPCTFKSSSIIIIYCLYLYLLKYISKCLYCIIHHNISLFDSNIFYIPSFYCFFQSVGQPSIHLLYQTYIPTHSPHATVRAIMTSHIIPFTHSIVVVSHIHSFIFCRIIPPCCGGLQQHISIHPPINLVIIR